MNDAAGRVEELLEQIRRSNAVAGAQLLRGDAAEQRSGPRSTAERLVVESDRVALVRDAREALRGFLDRRYAHFNLGMYYGTSFDPSTARDRIEIAVALDDLVLATAVEDLLTPDDFSALATDGANLILDIPTRSMFPAVAYAPESTDDSPTSGVVRVMQVTVVAVILVASVLAMFVLGIVPGLIGGCLAASIVASWIWRRRGDAARQESETP